MKSTTSTNSKALGTSPPLARHKFHHGGKKAYPAEYGVWLSMRTRCRNPRAKDFPYYGGRGIEVCRRWDSFPNFISDMGERPSPTHTIGRKNAARGYSPSNCRWETRAEQSRSRSFCRMTLARAEKVRTLYRSGRFTYRQLAARFGVGASTVGFVVTGRSWQL